MIKSICMLQAKRDASVPQKDPQKTNLSRNSSILPKNAASSFSGLSLGLLPWLLCLLVKQTKQTLSDKLWYLYLWSGYIHFSSQSCQLLSIHWCVCNCINMCLAWTAVGRFPYSGELQIKISHNVLIYSSLKLIV